jgi:phytoene dehydrogenase-like protein
MSNQYDAVIIGGGSNGLITAAYLAKAGQKVLVLEQRETPGGTAAREEFAPGFKTDLGQDVGWLPGKVASDLSLSRYGLNVQTANPTVFTPLPDGTSLTLWQDVGKTATEIAKFSRSDADKWPTFARFVARATHIMEQVYLTTPPDGLNITAADALALGPLGLQVRQLGDKDMVEFMKVLPMAAWEFFEDWFETPALQATLAAVAVKNIRQGPRSAGTTFMFLHHQVGNPEGTFRASRRVAGGIGKVLADAAKGHGAEIRTGARAIEVLVQDGAAVGVVLSDGTEIRAKRVVSSLDPMSTMLLVDPLELPPSYVRAVQNIKFRGAVGIVNLALSELPSFTAKPGDGDHLRGIISIGPDLTTLEKAYDASKYGQISETPMLEITIPSLSDPSMAPVGQHVMTIHAQFAPYQLRGGAAWDDAACETLLNNTLATLEGCAPNIRNAILHTQVITPADLEAVYGLTEGALYHGEMTLDQLFFMRPIPGYSRYQTPVEKLYMCGAGTHPGGGITGANAYNAVREILKKR